MNFLHVTFITFTVFGSVLCIPTQTTTTIKPKENAPSAFVPHTTYFGANSYMDNIPYGALNTQPSQLPQAVDKGYFNAIMPTPGVST